MQKISVIIANRHPTSISIEKEFLEELKTIAQNKRQSINQIVTKIDMERQNNNLSSAIRIYILQYLKSRLTT